MSFLTRDTPAMKSPAENPKPGVAIASEILGRNLADLKGVVEMLKRGVFDHPQKKIDKRSTAHVMV